MMHARRVLSALNGVEGCQNGIQKTQFVVEILNVYNGLFDGNVAWCGKETLSLGWSKGSQRDLEIDYVVYDPLRRATIKILDR